LSTKDLLRSERTARDNAAVLVGNPLFDLSEVQQRAAVAKMIQGSEAHSVAAPAPIAAGTRSQERGRAVGPLDGTQVEVDMLGTMLQGKGWRVERYTQERALEEALKRVKSPRVLHVATHGFFEPDQLAKQRNVRRDEEPSGLEDPMLRSGLLFAGANRTL